MAIIKETRLELNNEEEGIYVSFAYSEGCVPLDLSIEDENDCGDYDTTLDLEEVKELYAFLGEFIRLKS